jgi:thiol-disulfide isomerase/thioredoxin
MKEIFIALATIICQLVLIGEGFEQKKVYRLISGEEYDQASFAQLVKSKSAISMPPEFKEFVGKRLVPVTTPYLFKDGTEVEYFVFEWAEVNDSSASTYAGNLQEQKLDELLGKSFPFEKLEENNFDLKDRPVVINFWYTGCHGCIAEMPELNKLKATYVDQVDFLSIIWNNEKELERFLAKKKFTWTHFAGEKKFLKELMTGGKSLGSYPVTLLIDHLGVVRFHMGPLPEISDGSGNLEYQYPE